MSTVLICLDNLFTFMCGCSPLVYVCVSVGMYEFACARAYTCVHVSRTSGDSWYLVQFFFIFNFLDKIFH